MQTNLISLFQNQLAFLFLLTFLCSSNVVTATQPTPSTTSSSNLTGIYEGPRDEGRSLYYLHHEGNAVYFVGERYDAKFAYAFRDTISGTTITGEWYNLPQGMQRSNGTLQLQISMDRRTLSVLSETGGFMNTSITATPLDSHVPAPRRAHYRGNTLNNLTGRWHATNASMLQLLDFNGLIVFYGETPRFKKDVHNNGIPGKASLFFGKRNGEYIEGEWVDLPYGTISSKGEVRFKVIGPHYFRYDSGYYPGVNFNRVQEDIREILD